MTRILEDGRREPDGAPRQIVVFLHGYGANGADLLGLAEPMAPHMPGTLFAAPDAPERSVIAPMGLQWFPIPWLDGSDPAQAETGLLRAADDLDAYLDALLEETGLGPDRLALVGFSQGSMMALHVAPRRPRPVAAVAAFSGRLLQPEALAEAAVSKPPVLLLHGDRDDVVPPSEMPAAGEALREAGFEVYAHVMEGTAHGIAPDGLGVALAFLRERLGLET